MTFKVTVSRKAERYMGRQDRHTQERLARGLRMVAEDPFESGAKLLTGFRDRWSLRVGTRRILFTVDVVNRTVDVFAIGPRGEVYRDL